MAEKKRLSASERLANLEGYQQTVDQRFEMLIQDINGALKEYTQNLNMMGEILDATVAILAETTPDFHQKIAGKVTESREIGYEAERERIRETVAAAVEAGALTPSDGKVAPDSFVVAVEYLDESKTVSVPPGLIAVPAGQFDFDVFENVMGLGVGGEVVITGGRILVIQEIYTVSEDQLQKETNIQKVFTSGDQQVES